MNTGNSTLQALRRWLIEPHSSITEPVQRRRTRILAGLTLAMILASVPAFVWFLPTNPRAVNGLPAMAVIAIAYILSRTRWAEWGARLLVFGLVGVIFLIAVSTPDAQMTAQSGIFLVIPLLFSMLLLSAATTVLTASFILAGLLLVGAFAPWMELGQMTWVLIVIFLVSILAGGISYTQQRDLEIIRREAHQRVTSKQAQAEAERRMKDIVAISEVGRTITGARDLDSLLKQVVNLIVEQFDFYHAQVFLVDESSKNAVLKASTGVAGQELLSRGHRLAVGSQSVIGRVTARGEPVIALDTDLDPVHRRNELLPHTRSEMALALRVSGRVIGALDVQSTNPNAFDQEDISVFQAMADQLAVAIENARLFERAQHDLEDIETLNRQLTGEAWRKYLTGRAQVAPLGFQSSLEGIKPVSVAQDENESGTTDETGLSLPLRVRGETIGMLDLQPRDGQPPDEETRQMLEAVAERVALALDSTRLGEQAQRHAEREQILSRFSIELQSTTNLDAILSIAARESSRALGATRGFVHLTLEYGGKKEKSG